MQQLLFEHFGGWFTLQRVDLSSQIQSLQSAVGKLSQAKEGIKAKIKYEAIKIIYMNSNV